jgi:hypothetical protein
LSPFEHFLSALSWAWGSVYSLAQDKILWGMLIALAGAMIAGGITWKSDDNRKSLWSYIRSSVIAAVLSPVVVLGAVFIFNFIVLYPLERERLLVSRIEALENKQTAKERDAYVGAISSLSRILILRGCIERLDNLSQGFEKIEQSVLKNLEDGKSYSAMRDGEYSKWLHRLSATQQISVVCDLKNKHKFNGRPATRPDG